MKKLILALAIGIASASVAFAQAPAGYYKSLEGKKDAELKNEIYNLIHNFTRVSSYTDLPKYFQRTDVYPESSRWWDMYSDIPLYAPSFKGLNREHSFPKSWWGGSTSVGAYVDLNHLYPSEAAANMAKSNYPLGEVDTAEKVKFENGISTVGYPVTGQGGGCPWVFEPDDEYKGDFARTYFYMATCYQDLTWKYTYMVSQNLYPTLTGWAAQMLMRWHKKDPVSEKEIDRNNMIYQIQNNRNPFIDRPELADYLWGDKVGTAYTPSTQDIITGDPELTTPVQGMSLDFGDVAIGNKTTSQLFFHGQNLTGRFELLITGADKAMFSIPSSTLNTQLVNSESGTWLTITYTPAAVGRHQAKLLISDGGITGSRGIDLIGECFEKPVLTACTALAATDITAESYRANWTYPADETIDYWIVTRTRYVNGVATQEEILAEEPGIVIEDFDQSDSESYTVRSMRLGYSSPESNVIFVDHSGITGVQADQGLAVQGFDGFIRFICSTPQTGACIYDVAGSLIMYIDSVRRNLDVQLPTGVYLITTDQSHAPVKVVVR